MDRIELHDVEYGDCTVFVGRDQSVLMIDCGSSSEYTRRDGTAIRARFDAIFRRYIPAASRQFLLTHYHRDHMSGFLRKLRDDPNYFDLVYVPAVPFCGDACPVLEIALFSRHFSAPQSDFSQVNTACLSIFDRLQTSVGAKRIRTLCAGDVFSFDHTPYAVLSPDAAAFPYGEELVEAASALSDALAPQPDASDFLRLKDEFLHAYRRCQSAFSPSSKIPLEQREALLSDLSAVWRDLEALRGTFGHLPVLDTLREKLAAVRTLYTETQNALSLVFHNVRTHSGGPDVLMTGDADPAVLECLAPKLYTGYYTVKAPHHGTESHWCPLFSDMEIGHFLISNGDYHAGGAVSMRYIASESIKHCTNTSACPWFGENESCCNRLLRCYEQPLSGALTLKCPAAAGNRRTPCNIYVFGHNGVCGCHCDRMK